MSIKAQGPPGAMAGKRSGGGKGISRKAAAEIDEELRKKYGI